MIHSPFRWGKIGQLCLASIVVLTISQPSLVELCAQDNALTPQIVDETPALVIDGAPISRYLVEKYFLRFAQGFRGQNNRKPNAKESRAWFRLFIAQQAIIEDAIKHKYFERPDLMANVALMERYMLTQTEGPYYDILFKESPKYASAEIRLFRANQATSVDCVIARFANRTTANNLLGDNFDNCSPKVRMERLLRCADAPDIPVLNQAIDWPFQPVEELAELLLQSPQNRWTSVELPHLGFYYVYIRHKAINSSNSAFHIATFDKLLRASERTVIFRVHQRAILEQCDPIANTASCHNLASICAGLPAEATEIPAAALNNLLGEPLFSFLDSGERHQISIEEFCGYFNHLFIRSMPRNDGDLESYIQRFSVEQLDYEAALLRGVDKEKRFVQDREGFRRIQALALVERDSILPRLAPAIETEAKRYYMDHPLEFARAESIRCRLLRFEDMAAAHKWLWRQQATDDGESEVQATRPLSTADVAVSRDAVSDGFIEFKAALFGLSPGKYFGPIILNRVSTIVQKEQDLDFRPMLYDEVAQGIRFRYRRQALDSAELAMGKALLDGMAIKDNINYESYGAL